MLVHYFSIGCALCRSPTFPLVPGHTASYLQRQRPSSPALPRAMERVEDSNRTLQKERRRILFHVAKYQKHNVALSLFDSYIAFKKVSKKGLLNREHRL